MRSVDRFQIQEDVNALSEALQDMDERFLKDSDPSISVMNFIEKISNSMGAIKHLYTKGAHDRNQVADPIREHLVDMKASIAALEQSFDQAGDDPEDQNDELPSDKEG